MATGHRSAPARRGDRSARNAPPLARPRRSATPRLAVHRSPCRRAGHRRTSSRWVAVGHCSPPGCRAIRRSAGWRPWAARTPPPSPSRRWSVDLTHASRRAPPPAEFSDGPDPRSSRRRLDPPRRGGADGCVVHRRWRDSADCAAYDCGVPSGSAGTSVPPHAPSGAPSTPRIGRSTGGDAGTACRASPSADIADIGRARCTVPPTPHLEPDEELDRARTACDERHEVAGACRGHAKLEAVTPSFALFRTRPSP